MLKFWHLTISLLPFVFFSCAKTTFPSGSGDHKGYIKTNLSSRNEVIKTPELKQLLYETPKPKMVLRVPNTTSNVTASEESRNIDFNNIYNAIEKVFLKQGFIVRDRALLNNLLLSGNVDYKDIGEKIDTDLIIEILNIEFDISNKIKNFKNLSTSLQEEFPDWGPTVDCRAAKLECRITIVKKGQLGGIFTLFAGACDFGTEFWINKRNSFIGWKQEEVSLTEIYTTYSYNEESKIRGIERLANDLLNNLNPN